MEIINVRKSDLTVLIIALIIFLLNPTVALLFTLYYAIYSNNLEDNKGVLMVFFIMLSFWLASINITKTPASDQGFYIRLFTNSPKVGFYTTAFETLGKASGKEFFYGVYTWVMYYLCMGSTVMFFFWTTVFIYMLQFVACYKVFEKINASVGQLLCGVLVLAFFTQYFSLTNHVLRQILACSLVLYGISCRVCEEKKWWVLMICAFFIHSSAGFFMAMALVPSIYHRLKGRQLFFVAGGFIAFIIVSVAFTSVIQSFTGTGTSGLDYALTRLASNNTDTKENLSLSLMLLVMIPLTVGIINTLIRERDNEDAAIYPICYMAIALMIFILAMTRNPLTQYRFFFYCYSFVPFLLPVIFSKDNFYGKVFNWVVPIFFIVRFFMLHGHTGWKYAPMLDFLVSPFPLLFANSPLLNY